MLLVLALELVTNFDRGARTGAAAPWCRKQQLRQFGYQDAFEIATAQGFFLIHKTCGFLS